LQSALLALARATAEDVARVQGFVDMLPPLMSQPDEFLAVDIQFHLQIAVVARNPKLLEFLTTYFDHWHAIRESYPVRLVDLTTAVPNHQEILDAIAGRDRPRLVDAVDRHLAATERIFLGETLDFP